MTGEFPAWSKRITGLETSKEVGEEQELLNCKFLFYLHHGLVLPVRQVSVSLQIKTSFYTTTMAQWSTPFPDSQYMKGSNTEMLLGTSRREQASLSASMKYNITENFLQ